MQCLCEANEWEVLIRGILCYWARESLKFSNQKQSSLIWLIQQKLKQSANLVKKRPDKKE